MNQTRFAYVNQNRIYSCNQAVLNNIRLNKATG